MLKKFRYKNEAEFSHAVCRYLRNKGWFVQRIESGETGKGIPDLYIISPTGVAIWIELKREHLDTAGISSSVYVHWRQGQQAWLHSITKLKQKAYTLACFDNVILQIPHEVIYKDNLVNLSGVTFINSLSQL